jgi:hypothetical protein
MKEGTKIKLLAVTLGVLLLLMLVTTIGRWYQQIIAVGPYREVYSAYVLEKQTIRLETREGGVFARVLIVRDLNGNRFRVKVSEKIYQRAERGMFIEKFARDAEPTLAP